MNNTTTVAKSTIGNVKDASMADALKQLNIDVTNMLVFFNTIDTNDIPTLLKAFKQLHEQKETLVNLAKAVTDMYQTLSYKTIPETFENHGYDSIKAAGRNFILSARINASIPVENRDQCHTWLRSEAKIPELINDYVNPKQLSSFASKYIEEHGKDLPEIFNVHKQKYISVRKA